MQEVEKSEEKSEEQEVSYERPVSPGLLFFVRLYFACLVIFHSFVRSFVRSFFRSFVRSSVRPFVHPSPKSLS